MAGRNVGIDELEAAMAEGWWPLEHRWLGCWLLRASAGFTGRGNSALPLGGPGCDLPTALDRVETFYRDRGLPPRFSVPGPVVGDVDRGRLAEALGARGYAAATPTAVMTADAAEVTRVAGVADAPASGLRLLDEPDDAWLALYRYRGQRLPPEAGRLLRSAPYQRFAAVIDDGRTVAVGRLAIARGWAGITAMQVAETHRRRRLGWAVLAALAGHAVDRGAPHLYLQVAVENTAARRLYASAGFRDHHGYHYRVLGPEAARERHVTRPTEK
jgi:N-acetylglutamate synthase